MSQKQISFQNSAIGPEQDEEEVDDHISNELWVRDLRRWIAATLSVCREEDQAKIHIAMLRREFILAAREKSYYASLVAPLERPRSRESRSFLKVLLSIVGIRAKQAQCVINGINQIGITGYRYKRPTAEDYAAVANGRADLAETVRKIETAAAASTIESINTKRKLSAISNVHTTQIHDQEQDNMVSDHGETTFSPPQGTKICNGSSPQQVEEKDSLQQIMPMSVVDHTTEIGQDVQLQFAVRTFKVGARQQLLSYNLAALREPLTAEALGFELNKIAEGYRTDTTSVHGFDAVALGLLCLGTDHPPLPYALRTLTVVDNIVRVSSAATDTRLSEYLDFDKVLAVFDSQLMPLANKLCPEARWLAVEAHSGSYAFAKYKERGLPVIDASTGIPKNKIDFVEWTPSPIYCAAFPRRHPEVVYLRAKLPFYPAVGTLSNSPQVHYTDIGGTLSTHAPLIHFDTENLSGQVIVDSKTATTKQKNLPWYSASTDHRALPVPTIGMTSSSSTGGTGEIFMPVASNALRNKKTQPEPPWVEDVRLWARRFLVPSSQARVHVSELRNEFLKYKRSFGGDDHIDYTELSKLFGLPKSHESRIFTLTILSVVGETAKRQQCVIGGVNQCGIVGWKIDYSKHHLPSSDQDLPNTSCTSVVSEAKS